MSYKSVLRSGTRGHLCPRARVVRWCAGGLAGLLICGAPSADPAIAPWVPGAGRSGNPAPDSGTGLIPNTLGDSPFFNTPTPNPTVAAGSGTAGFPVGAP